MQVNIKNNEIISIDFLTVDEVIEFIKKFNKDEKSKIGLNQEEPFINLSDKPLPV